MLLTGGLEGEGGVWRGKETGARTLNKSEKSKHTTRENIACNNAVPVYTIPWNAMPHSGVYGLWSMEYGVWSRE